MVQSQDKNHSATGDDGILEQVGLKIQVSKTQQSNITRA